MDYHMEMVRYSIVACHLNMASTVERSLRAILDPLNSRFEVVLVDGGSTDGSLDILRRLTEEYDQLRVVELDPDPDRKLGTDRNIAVEHAEGDFVIGAMDLDDHYYPGVVQAFTSVYEQLRKAVDREFVLHGSGIYVAPRELRRQYPFPNIARCEDRYFWRRLHADGRIMWIKHGPLGKGSLGYDRSSVEAIRNDVEEKACDFQQGITFRSAIRYTFRPSHPYILERERGAFGTLLKRMYDLITYFYAFVLARSRDRYTVPDRYRQRGAVEQSIQQNQRWLREIEEELDISIDRDALRQRGREIFYSAEASH